MTAVLGQLIVPRTSRLTEVIPIRVTVEEGTLAPATLEWHYSSVFVDVAGQLVSPGEHGVAQFARETYGLQVDGGDVARPIASVREHLATVSAGIPAAPASLEWKAGHQV